MAQTDAEQRDFSGEMADHVERDTGLVGRAGAWRKHDAFGRESFDLLDRDPVVAGDFDLTRNRQVGAQLAQILDEVVGE
jgi:hypothetical protein